MPTGSPEAASQSRAVLSPPPVTTVLPSGLKAAATTGTGVGQNCPESGVVGLPGGQVGPGGVLPGTIAGRDRRSPALDHPEQARADLIFLEGGLAAIEVADRQQTVRFAERCLEAFSLHFEVGCKTADSRGCAPPLGRKVALPAGIDHRENRHTQERGREEGCCRERRRLRRANFRSWYKDEGGHATTGSWFK